MQIINQPWDGPQERVGDIITRELATNAIFNSFILVVAFAKQAGVAALQPHIQRFLADGHGVEAFVGIDALGTSREALSLLLDLGVPTHVFHNPGHTFHPKMYLLEGANDAFAVIGSSNLTVGGLYTNYELGAGLRLNLAVAAERTAYDDLRNVIDSLRGSINTKDLTAELLDELSTHGLLGLESLLEDEAEAQAESTHARREAGAGIFERTPVPPPPRLTAAGGRRPPAAAAPLLPGMGVGATQFVMILGHRDAQRQPGYSPDIFIPIAARNAEPAFWRWPENYVRVSANGVYDERRVNILVQAEDGPRLVRGVRVYYYHDRSEFRLNCSELVALATEGDLLVLESPLEPSPDVDYLGSVVPQTSSLFPAFRAIAANAIRNSPKYWGYA